jgi:hypothetical protein
MELFTGLEADSLARSDLNLRSSPRVPTDSGLPWFDGEDSEAAKLNSVASNERLFHAVEDSVHRSLRFCSWQASSLNNPLDEILFYHSGSPSLGCKFW